MSVSPVLRSFSKRLSIIVLSSLLISGTVLTRHPAARAEQLPAQSPKAALEARCLNAGNVRIAQTAHSDALRFVGARPGDAIAQPSALPANASPEAAARAYLGACGSLFGIQDASAELATQRSAELQDGRSVVRFQQTHRGIPIMAAETIVMLDGQGSILTVVNETSPGVLPGITAAIDATAARESALGAVAKSNDLDQSALASTEPQLWIYDPVLMNPADAGPAVLVWRMEVTSDDGPVNELVLVDANRGSIALKFSQIESSAGAPSMPAAPPHQPESDALPAPSPVLGTPLISIYDMAHAISPLPGTLICDETNPSACDSDPDAQKAWLYLLDTYQFYATAFGRDSVNAAGLRLIASVHVGTNWLNAEWTGTQMKFGDGFAQAEDVVGHELTHAVTQYESNLLYYYQSGAINESLSDVFGELIEKANQGDADWLMGEDVPGGAIRSMSDPTVYFDPDKLSSANYYAGAIDNGGVHWNSGVNNKAAYLMTDGGTFNGYTVAALGATKVARIYYEAQANLLTSGSDYADLYYALNQACLLNVGGPEGITAANCQQVRYAINAVEMNSAAGC